MRLLSTCCMFSSRNELIDFASKQKKILVAINAEKILHATDETRALINNNIGYSDGIGAVWALKKKGSSSILWKVILLLLMSATS